MTYSKKRQIRHMVIDCIIGVVMHVTEPVDVQARLREHQNARP